MKHNIRINGQVKEIDCELGSGILDENGREIFEGNKVSWLNGKKQSPVYFVNGGLVMHDWDGYHLLTDFPYELEIVDD